MHQFSYMPILKGKRAEFKALTQLSADIIEKIRPLIEIEPVPHDPDTEMPDKSYTELLTGYGAKLAQAWPNQTPLLLDGNLIDEEDLEPEETHPLIVAIHQARESGVYIVPVTSPTRSPLYKSAVQKVLANEVCLRLQIADLMNPQLIKNYIDDIGISLDKIDVVIDLHSSLDDSNLQTSALVAVGGINNLPHLQDYRSITLASGSFPRDLSLVQVGTAQIPRLEWDLWKAIVRMPGLNRSVIYGDYGVQHPEYTRLATRFPSVTASIRYTADDYFLIFRGKVARVHGYEQYGEHCRELIDRPEYPGQHYSEGDLDIWKYAHDEVKKPNGEITYGSAEVWRRVAANHHITLVIRQLSNQT